MPKTVLTRYDIWDLNLGRVPHHPVKDGWDDISLYYAKALQHMGWKDPAAPDHDVENTWTYNETDPTSYYFQAAVHWTPRALRPDQAYWDHCTHGSGENYFLAWHRAYIYWFEVIIRGFVARLGGPEDWALPYWNYSYYDPHDPRGPWPRSELPKVFGYAKLPDGTNNPLYMPQHTRRGLQPGQLMRRTTPYYNQAYAWTHFLPTLNLGGFNPTIDGQPHGAVHDNVGSGTASWNGWMGSVPTAAFDPVFWLHHSEIDRFWVGWNANGHGNPSDATWLQALDDPERDTRWEFWKDANRADTVVVYPGTMVDPANLPAPCPYSYRYANLPQTPAPAPLRRPGTLAGVGPTAKNSILATREDVAIGGAPVSATLDLKPEARETLARVVQTDERAPAETPPRVILHLEQVTADGPPGSYELYLNYPDATYETAGDHPHYVGILAGFGADHVHQGHVHGIKADFDITDLVAYLQRTSGWDPARATVTFVPTAPGQREAEARPRVRVGHVSIRSISESE